MPKEYSDEHAQSRSLIRIFTGRILARQGFTISNADNED